MVNAGYFRACLYQEMIWNQWWIQMMLRYSKTIVELCQAITLYKNKIIIKLKGRAIVIDTS